MRLTQLKTFRHKPGRDWAWDHPLTGDIGDATGRWEITLYALDGFSEDGCIGYAALAELENGHSMVIIVLEEGGNRLELIRSTLEEAKATLDQLLGASTPELPADREAADPWAGHLAEQREILRWMQHSEEYRREVRSDVDTILRKHRDSSSGEIIMSNSLSFTFRIGLATYAIDNSLPSWHLEGGAPRCNACRKLLHLLWSTPSLGLATCTCNTSAGDGRKVVQLP
jgi:hypothetical protein